MTPRFIIRVTNPHGDTLYVRGTPQNRMGWSVGPREAAKTFPTAEVAQAKFCTFRAHRLTKFEVEQK